MSLTVIPFFCLGFIVGDLLVEYFTDKDYKGAFWKGLITGVLFSMVMIPFSRW